MDPKLVQELTKQSEKVSEKRDVLTRRITADMPQKVFEESIRKLNSLTVKHTA